MKCRREKGPHYTNPLRGIVVSVIDFKFVCLDTWRSLRSSSKPTHTSYETIASFMMSLALPREVTYVSIEFTTTFAKAHGLSHLPQVKKNNLIDFTFLTISDMKEVKI